MAIARWSPFQELTTLHTTMDRLFTDMLEGGDDTATSGMPTFRLPIDISETDNGYLIKAPIAGFKPEEVEVHLSDGVLSISAKHKEEKTEKKGKYLRREVALGNFERQIALPKDVRGEDIKATFNNGVLAVEVPRAPKSQPKRIEVRTDEQKQGAAAGQQQMAGAGNNRG